MNCYPKPFPPPWAEAWGDDRYGLWAELLVNGVTQRMRWLAAGSFMMGSPDHEPDRDKNEGPQHRVTLTQDLWLADTACTQALWLAVMGGDNPSDVKDDLNKPVVQVSWDDVQGFFAALQMRGALPAGVEAVLPTEAQWEYACRVGTELPFSFADQIRINHVDYSGSNPYRKGPKGEDRDKTLPVKALPANSWGLYQMDGNVWEWCADAQRTYTKAAVTDPSGAMGEGVNAFAVRGGGWSRHAQRPRAAQRLSLVRAWRSFSLGFRFALRSTGQSGASRTRPEGA